MKAPGETRLPAVVLISLALAAGLSSVQPGSWLIGLLGFSLLTIAGLWALTRAVQWADAGRPLPWIVTLAFALRLASGIVLFLALPSTGYDDPDDQAGYVYTDAHRRDSQAWELARSEQPILDAFSREFYTDQYGGLLGLSALLYRYLSPDSHRPLMLVLLSALIAALGVPFLSKAAGRMWGQSVSLAACWIFALYPESVLLGGAAMREPYLMTFSAIGLWGFLQVQQDHTRHGWLWLGASLIGMLLISPVTALITLIILMGWMYLAGERGRLAWWPGLMAALLFVVAMLLLSWALNRQGNLDSGTPVGVIGNFLREAVKWDVYQLERGSGWVQKLFDEMPEWLRLPFVVIYGVLQPVLPAAVIEPTTITWRLIAVLRAVGWYMLLPMLVLSFPVAAALASGNEGRLLRWIGIVTWSWILLAALRGGGDQWDNPRYRAMLLLWQAILASHAWVWWRAARSPWGLRILAMEAVLLLFFGEWYAYRYLHIGEQMAFGQMVAAILGVWAVIVLGGWLWDRRRLTGPNDDL